MDVLTQKCKLKSLKFPQKLFKVAHDGIIIKWADNGLGIIIEEFEFEDKVMELYPGFVQVESFHNLRRLLRDYGFLFSVLRKRKPFGLKIEYSHRLFSADASDLQLIQIHKRKRIRRPLPLATSPISPIRIKAPRRRTQIPRSIRHDSYDTDESFLNVSFSFDDEGNTLFPSSTAALSCHRDTFSTPYARKTVFPRQFNRYTSGERRNTCKPFHGDWPDETDSAKSTSALALTKRDKLRLLQVYGKNEMDEPEFVELMLKEVGGSHDLASSGTWETTMKKVEKLVSYELSPFSDPSNFIPVSFATM